MIFDEMHSSFKNVLYVPIKYVTLLSPVRYGQYYIIRFTDYHCRIEDLNMSTFTTQIILINKNI